MTIAPSEQTGGSAGRGQDGGIPPDLVALYRQQERRIYRLCLSYLKNASDAEDATQETFVRAARRLAQLEGDPCAYLTAVARNVCCDDLRRRGRATDATRRGLHRSEPRADAESEVLARATLEGVWLNLQRHERTMLLESFAGYSYDEISRRSGLSIPAVASIISRARQRARRAAESVASVLIPVVGWRRLQARVSRIGSTGGIETLGLQSSALLVGSVVSCLVAGTLAYGTSAPNGMLPPGSGSGTAYNLGHAPAAGLVADGATSPRWSSGATVTLGSGGSGRTGHDASGGTALGLAGSILAPPPAQQQDTQFDGVQPSPHYAQDGTIFASGTVVHDCRQATCPVLFRSTDRGVSWQQVSATGFRGGTILLPPDFPANPTIFAMDRTLGLARSDDGGHTFTMVAPVAAPAAAVAPDSPPGDAHVLIASNPPVVYSQRSGLVSTALLLPAGISEVDDVAFAGGSGHVVFTGQRPDPSGTGYQDAVIVDCTPACRYSFIGPDMALALAVSPQFASDATYFAYGGRRIYVTRTGGASFTTLASPLLGTVDALALSPSFARDGRAVASSYTLGAGLVPQSAIAMSDDGVRAFTALDTAGLPAGHVVAGLSMLPDGHILAALAGADTAGLFGIRCSVNGGLTWTMSC